MKHDILTYECSMFQRKLIESKRWPKNIQRPNCCSTSVMIRALPCLYIYIHISSQLVAFEPQFHYVLFCGESRIHINSLPILFTFQSNYKTQSGHFRNVSSEQYRATYAIFVADDPWQFLRIYFSFIIKLNNWSGNIMYKNHPLFFIRTAFTPMRRASYQLLVYNRVRVDCMETTKIIITSKRSTI